MKQAGNLILFFLVLSAFLFGQHQQPKNIILLIGDGMGVSAVSSSVLSGKSPFTRFTTTGFSITTALDNLITDSAASATAISTGTKTNNGFISMTPSGEKLKTLFEEAEEKGMSTGFVVTSSVTHATPAAFYSHTISRKNESDIARQLIDTETEVVIGAGQKFFPKSEWESTKTKLTASGYNIFTDAQSLIQDKRDGKIFAIIGTEDVPAAAKRKFRLSELVSRALEVLRKDKDGFILMVEGSQIDWAEHENDPAYLLSEMKDFSGAIETALNFAAEENNTLVLVTSDHETGGVAVTGGEPDGTKIQIDFSTFYHTATMVGVFAKGPGEELFGGIQQNNELGKKLFQLLKKDGKSLN